MKVRLAVLGVDGRRNKAGMSFLAKGVEFKAPEVPVWLEARTDAEHDIHHLLGTAKLSLHDEVLWADCLLLDDKLPGSLLKNLYPHACGAILQRGGDVIQRMLITGLNISSDVPLDERVATLDAQGVKATKKG